MRFGEMGFEALKQYAKANIGLFFTDLARKTRSMTFKLKEDASLKLESKLKEIGSIRE